ncbi:MAG: hypothetical protein WC444_06870 [Candidatus Paceibacterota bacterium]
MPKAFDDMLSSIKKTLSGQKNPRTGKSYTESDMYAVAVDAYKKKFGTAPTSGETKNVVVAENVRVNFSGYAEVLE